MTFLKSFLMNHHLDNIKSCHGRIADGIMGTDINMGNVDGEGNEYM